MTPTERAKRSDALYYETVSVTRRVLCDMIANREADLDDAQAENAKLRELVRAAYNCTNAGPSCLECRVVAGGCTLLSAMHELGIEVDE